MPLNEKIEKYLTEQITYPEEKVPGVIGKKMMELKAKLGYLQDTSYYKKNWREGIDVIALIDRLIKHIDKI